MLSQKSRSGTKNHGGLKITREQHERPEDKEEESSVEEETGGCRTASFTRNGYKRTEGFLDEFVGLGIGHEEKDQRCIQRILGFESKVYAVVGLARLRGGVFARLWDRFGFSS